MKITSERIPEAQIRLEIELDDDQVRKARTQAARRLSNRFKIPGFRKGKAPLQVVERTLSPEAVNEEASERLFPQVLAEAIEQEGLETVAPPQIDDIKPDMSGFTAIVPLPPVIELGEYRTIAVAKPESEFSDELVETQILELRRRYAVLEPVERAPELNDRVSADIRATVEDEEILNQEAAEFHLREGQVIGVPGLSERLVGLEVGVEHEIDIDVEEDWDDPEVAGKTVTFTVTMHDVKSEELPEADDDFALEVSEEYESFADLRSRMAEQLEEQADRQVEDQFQRAVLEAVIAQATLEYPPALVEHEVEHMRQDFARQMGQDPATFLTEPGDQQRQLLDSFRGQAHDRVINTLVLQEISEAETIEVIDAEVDAEMEKLLGGSTDPQALELMQDEAARENVRGRLVRERTLERLQQIALANAAAQPADGEDADADDTGGPDDAADDADQTEATEDAAAAE